MNNKIFYNDAALFALKTNFEYNEFNNLKNNNNNNLEVDESKKSLPKLKHMKKNENKPESDLQTNPTLNEKMKDEKSVKTEEISPITRNPIVEKVEPKKETNNTNIINESAKKKSIPYYVLDPLSVIIKLAILSKKDIGCKLCVYKNTLCIQENGFFQSTVRYLYNNKKEDLNYLYNPIEFACRHFLYEQKNIDLRPIFINAQNGIKNLLIHYKNEKMIVHTLFMYNNLIANYLGDNFNPELFIKDDLSELYSVELLEKIHSVWTENKLKTILNLTDLTNNNVNIRCLEDFMIPIDEEESKLVMEHTL